jgi:hypothetical protein
MSEQTRCPHENRPDACPWCEYDAVSRERDIAVDLIDRARQAVTYALRCPGHPWHDSDEARKWLMDADRAGEQ